MAENEEALRKNFVEEVLAVGGKARRGPALRQEEPQTGKARVRSAERKQALTVRLSPATVKQFKTLAATLEKPQEAVMAEALNLLFKRYREPEIA